MIGGTSSRRSTAIRRNCVPEPRYGPHSNSIQYLSRVTYCGWMVLFASTATSSRKPLRAVGAVGRSFSVCTPPAGFPWTAFPSVDCGGQTGKKMSGYGAHIAVQDADADGGRVRVRGGASPRASFVRNLRCCRAELSPACSWHHAKRGGVGTL